MLGNLATAQRMIDDERVPAATRARLIIDLLDRAGLKPADVHALVTPDTVAPDLDEAMRGALAARGLLPEEPEPEDGGQGGDEDDEPEPEA